VPFPPTVHAEEGGDDQKPYLLVPKLCPYERVLAWVGFVSDEVVVACEALSLHAAVHAWLPFET